GGCSGGAVVAGGASGLAGFWGAGGCGDGRSRDPRGARASTTRRARGGRVCGRTRSDRDGAGVHGGAERRARTGGGRVGALALLPAGGGRGLAAGLGGTGGGARPGGGGGGGGGPPGGGAGGVGG